MKKLSIEKRNQLLAVVLIVAALGGAWYWLVYRAQSEGLQALAGRKTETQRQLEEVRRTIEAADQIENQLTDGSKQVAQIEDGMASGDLYSWTINMIRQFKTAYKIDIPQFSQIDGPKDVSLIGAFPYKQASVTVSGTAFFYDFGKFVADFENAFPYVRISNLSLEPVSGLVAGEHERLAFKMDIAVLVKPSSS